MLETIDLACCKATYQKHTKAPVPCQKNRERSRKPNFLHKSSEFQEGRRTREEIRSMILPRYIGSLTRTARLDQLEGMKRMILDDSILDPETR